MIRTAAAEAKALGQAAAAVLILRDSLAAAVGSLDGLQPQHGGAPAQDTVWQPG